jgi:hypothetical protein
LANLAYANSSGNHSISNASTSSISSASSGSSTSHFNNAVVGGGSYNGSQSYLTPSTNDSFTPHNNTTTSASSYYASNANQSSSAAPFEASPYNFGYVPAHAPGSSYSNFIANQYRNGGGYSAADPQSYGYDVNGFGSGGSGVVNVIQNSGTNQNTNIWWQKLQHGNQVDSAGTNNPMPYLHSQQYGLNSLKPAAGKALSVSQSHSSIIEGKTIFLF